MKYYTWKDIDRRILLSREKWEGKIINIEVYPERILVETISEDDAAIYELIGTVLEKKLDEGELTLDFADSKMIVEIEHPLELEENNPMKKQKVLPLFCSVQYQKNSAYDEKIINRHLSGVPVIAFHSYKGGVGRSLSLLSFVKGWTEERDKDYTLLVVDSDFEAPGLTWICVNDMMDQQPSYLDLLVLAQQSRDARELAEKMSKEIKSSTMAFENSQRIFKQYFLPLYRYEQQLLDMYAAPQSIVQGYHKRYFLAELLSELGKALQVEAVIVDLRAGLSEFSAPFLFDPRVKKYIVTSTSLQSCYGTELLLGQLLKGLKIDADTNLPEVLLTMVQNNEDTEEIHDRLIKPFTNILTDGIPGQAGDAEGDYLDHVIYELDYASELIRLGTLQSIMDTLDGPGRKFHGKICSVVKNNLYVTTKEKQEFSITELERSTAINKIHLLADNQLTAEGSGDYRILKTKAITNLVNRFSQDRPNAVIIGAKGSGKTYLYREILKRETWEKFVSDISEAGNTMNNTVVVPLLATTNIALMSNQLTKAIRNFETAIDYKGIDRAFYENNRKEIVEMLQNEHTETDWGNFWKSLMITPEMQSLGQLDTKLKDSKKKIVFLIDGLEETFENTLDNENEQRALKALFKDVINEMRISYENISCLVFTRKDIVQNVITTNYEQFISQYKGLELRWSKAEALRMALWLVSQAVDNFNMNNIRIEDASEMAIRKELERLWGTKLGRSTSNEAYSSNWILAALSDFNGQLQARDIIRFLYFATEEIGGRVYDDRYIMPREVRNAIPKCSDQKITEIEQEIKVLKPIFNKFRSVKSEKRHMPFELEMFKLTKADESIMTREGYLYNDNGKYYLPEIIRHALEFTYEKGARPKVLALMARKGKI